MANTSAKKRLADQVAEDLQALIFSEYKSGDKLPIENDLAQKFSVSRITIREAISKLKVMGLVDVRQGEGTFVRDLTPSSFIKPIFPMLKFSNADVSEIFEVRILIECKAVESAALYASTDELEELKQLVDQMETAAMNNEMSLFNEYDIEFHHALAACSHNQVICTIHELLLDLISEAILISCNLPEHMLKSVILHNRIYQAIIHHQPEEAVQAMSVHLKGGLDFIQQRA